jgi:hypothetical protein
VNLTNSANPVVFCDDVRSSAASYVAPALCFINVAHVTCLGAKFAQIYERNKNKHEILS